MSADPLAPLAELERIADTGDFMFDAADRLCVGVPARRFLHGGVAFAACIEAMERASGAPAIQVSVQFLSVGRPRDCVHLAPRIATKGNSVSQYALQATIDGTTFANAHGSFGQRGSEIIYAVLPPSGPGWEDSAPFSVVYLLSTRIEKLFEFRLAAGEVPDRSDWAGSGGKDIAFWIRPRSGQPIGRPLLAVIADLVPIALHGALGRLASGTSLDNAIRFVTSMETDRVLVKVVVDAVHGGFAHLRTHLFASDGQLLAVASQSLILRLWDQL